ncbi:MAG: hypothetical protein ACTSR2_01155 [Candidatus Hodarchaeales archaeon]
MEVANVDSKLTYEDLVTLQARDVNRLYSMQEYKTFIHAVEAFESTVLGVLKENEKKKYFKLKEEMLSRAIEEAKANRVIKVFEANGRKSIAVINKDEYAVIKSKYYLALYKYLMDIVVKRVFIRQRATDKIDKPNNDEPLTDVVGIDELVY